jgi:hypothetical protein
MFCIIVVSKYPTFCCSEKGIKKVDFGKEIRDFLHCCYGHIIGSGTDGETKPECSSYYGVVILKCK